MKMLSRSCEAAVPFDTPLTRTTELIEYGQDGCRHRSLARFSADFTKNIFVLNQISLENKDEYDRTQSNAWMKENEEESYLVKINLHAGFDILIDGIHLYSLCHRA